MYGVDGNCSGASLSCLSAAVMNACQICVGKVPPATGSPLNSVSIGFSLSGYPTQTATASCGVYPTNHASP